MNKKQVTEMLHELVNIYVEELFEHEDDDVIRNTTPSERELDFATYLMILGDHRNVPLLRRCLQEVSIEELDDHDREVVKRYVERVYDWMNRLVDMSG